jgi:hypothetical protein
VTHATREGNMTMVRTPAPELVLRAMLAQDPGLTGLEVNAMALEDAFLALTQQAVSA